MSGHPACSPVDPSRTPFHTATPRPRSVPRCTALPSDAKQHSSAISHFFPLARREKCTETRRTAIQSALFFCFLMISASSYSRRCECYKDLCFKCQLVPLKVEKVTFPQLYLTGFYFTRKKNSIVIKHTRHKNRVWVLVETLLKVFDVKGSQL